MPGENIQDWSTTATLNSNADSSIDWSEGQTRASVNNSSRSMMAAHAKDRDLKNGSIVTAGTANAQTFFSGLNYLTVPTGLRTTLKIGPDLTNTAAATLDMDNLGPGAIKTIRADDLGANALIAGSYAEFIYDGTNWILLGITEADGVLLTQNIPGLTDGVEAAAGIVGEFKTAASGAWSVAAGAVGTLCSLAVDAGDWEMWGVVGAGPGATATGVFATLLIGPTVDSASSGLSYHGTYSTPAGEFYSGTVPMRVFNAAATYNLNMMNSSSSPAAITGIASSARIFARRVR